jgi:SNF2 family DNA or RNA helicase
MTLNTFHFAGVASKSNVTRGVPRIEEILSLSSEIKNPSLSIYLKPEDERQKAVDDFQSGKIKWILFTAQAGGVGITLTAARRLVMLQRPWSLVDHKQAIDRIHRIGSEIHDSVIVMDYVTEGTIEERVLQVLETKAENFEQIVRDKDRLLDLLKEDKAGKL